jgi:hypothetical protein
MNTVKILQGRASSDAAPPRAFDGSRGKGFREMRARVTANASVARACGKIAAEGAQGASRTTIDDRPTGSRIMYQSDITQFINQLKEKNPKLEGEQRQGRALLWDKQPIDLDERKSVQDSRVKQSSYVYYQNF